MIMKRARLVPSIGLALAVLAAPSIADAVPMAVSGPDSCIALNGGDWNACNVGNSGRGDLPYRPVMQSSPDRCIALNGGDWNACAVGNSGRGDLPYLPADH
jgi:roadblock/LC7 domain-containing protein